MLNSASPRSGETLGEVKPTSIEELRACCDDAGRLFRSVSLFGNTSDSRPTSLLLGALADSLESNAARLIEILDAESALGETRLKGELARTVFQLRAHAGLVGSDFLLQPLSEKADSNRIPPLSKQFKMNIPLGPVAVFAASNFPLAFGVLGGDTASALAAGCPVIVKAHPAQPLFSDAVKTLVSDCLIKVGIDGAWLQVVASSSPSFGKALVQHPEITAVGFTGSKSGGLALKGYADERPVPIPVYAEMSSINPVFIGPNAAKNRSVEIGKNWATVLAANAGQLCTKPGLLIVPTKEDAEIILNAAAQALAELEIPPLLTLAMAENYFRRISEVRDAIGMDAVNPQSASNGFQVSANVMLIPEASLERNSKLFDEIFGPAGIVVSHGDPVAFLEYLEGNLTSTVFMDEGDEGWFQQISSALARNAGRLVFNKWPTGVSVGLATVHGGPFPATSAPQTTSVGFTSSWRFMRPICFDGFPSDLTPEIKL
jgi:alpha-ketoglutaric semialdehyde dehydrogenase